MIVIRNGRVLDHRQRTAPAADILVRDGCVAEIGAPGLAAPQSAQVIDATDRLLMPGLINAHTHSHGNLQRIARDVWTLELLLNAGPQDHGHQLLEDKQLTSMLGAAEMISRGCTACYDLFYEFPLPSADGLTAVAQGYANAGMRAVIAPMLADCTFYQAVPGLLEVLPDPFGAAAKAARNAPWKQALGVIATALAHWPFDREHQTLAVAPTIPMHCSDALLVAAARFTREQGIGFHTHLAESKVQAVYGKQRYGRTITAHLDSLGVLGPNFTAAHGVWIDDDDMARLAGAGAALSHNPGSNFRLGNGLAAVRRMLDKRLVVGVGTDSRHCADNLNMFQVMRWASFVSRVQGPDHTRWLTTAEVFRMATENSARALGFGDRLGKLAPGYKADIVFLDLGNLNYVPLNDVVNQVVHAEDGTAVASVMVDGRMIYDNRRFTTFDYDRLIAAAHRASDRLCRANTEQIAFADTLSSVVGSFCGALGARHYHVERYAGGQIA